MSKGNEEYKKYEPVFGAWYLGKMLGKGSFGKVFEITREEFGETYKAALKIISVPQDDNDVKMRLSEGSTDVEISEYYEELMKEVVSENRIMSQLKGNSNIVSYEDHQIIPHNDGIGYDVLIRMELLTPLVDRMIEKKLDRDEVVKLGIDMCRALELCHEKNFIHRDIKPQNIFVSDHGDYKLGDFGIARTMEKTAGGMSRKGTREYMAPEVIKGENYDSTVDIYSLGMVLYILMNGNRRPFLPLPPAKVTPDDEETANMRRFSGEPLPPPAEADSMLSYIILKACMADPKSRYQTATQMRKVLEAYQRNCASAEEMTAGREDAAMTLSGEEASATMEGPETAVPAVSAAPAPMEATTYEDVKEKPRKRRYAAAAGAILIGLCIFAVAAGTKSCEESVADVYEEYAGRLKLNEDDIKSYWWQRDSSRGYPNEEYMQEGESLPLANPENRCVAVTDIWGDETPELMYFKFDHDDKADLEFNTYDPEYGCTEAYYKETGFIDGGPAPWGDTLFTDNRNEDTEYIIYTGKEDDTFYIVSSNIKDGITYSSSVMYEADEYDEVSVVSYVINEYRSGEDGSEALDRYYIDGKEVSKEEGAAAFKADAEDFGKLLMLSGNDKESLSVFEKAGTEAQAAATFDDAYECLKGKKETPVK